MTEPSDPTARIEDDSMELKLHWPFGMAMPSVYATQVSITQTGNEVILEFGEFLPTGMSNRTKEDVRELAKSLEVRVVARVIMSLTGYSTMEKLVKRLADHELQEDADNE